MSSLPSIIPTGGKVTRAQVMAVQAELMKLPQIEPVTEHFFANGMYLRKVWRPACALVVGKIHKHEHFFVLVTGDLLVWTGEVEVHLAPGDIVVSKPGTKRITYAYQDSIAMTVHRTDKTDIDEIEKEIIEAEESSMFDSGNILKLKRLS